MNKYFYTHYWAYNRIIVNYFCKLCNYFENSPKSACLKSTSLNSISNTTFLAQKCVLKSKITV